MSTNYYFRNVEMYKKYQDVQNRYNDKIEEAIEIIKEINDDKDVVRDARNQLEWSFNLEEACDIHIGQSAHSWATLLKVNKDYYTNLEEMKAFYENKKDELVIVDEYDSELSWGELEQRCLNRKGRVRGDIVDADGNCWMDGEFS